MWMFSRLLSFMSLLWFSHSALARDWHSADGKSRFTAVLEAHRGTHIIVKYDDGNTRNVPVTALSKEDQDYLKLAATISAESLKLGLTSYLAQRQTDGGWLCRMGKEMASQKGKYLFTGEQFFLLEGVPASLQNDTPRLLHQLYLDVPRTFVPLEGALSTIRVFNTSLEAAVNNQLAAKASTTLVKHDAVYEPLIEMVTRLSLGIIVSDKGHVLIDSALLKDSKEVNVDVGNNHAKATMVAAHAKLGLAVVKVPAPLVMGRFGSKKPLELGQSLFAVAVPPNATKKGLGSPAMTRCIVSRMIDAGNAAGTFEHDAHLAEDVLGGAFLTEKGEVAGLFFGSVEKKSRGDSQDSSSSPPEPVKRVAYPSPLVDEWLSTVPGVGGLKNSGTSPLEEAVPELKSGFTLVTALQEVVKHRPRIALVAPGATGGGHAAATGWSLSKSGTRHNSKCKFYDAAKACQPTDGKPCKVCGG
jgi:S1-C subfamily serine protease